MANPVHHYVYLIECDGRETYIGVAINRGAYNVGPAVALGVSECKRRNALGWFVRSIPQILD